MTLIKQQTVQVIVTSHNNINLLLCITIPMPVLLKYLDDSYINWSNLVLLNELSKYNTKVKSNLLT